MKVRSLAAISTTACLLAGCATAISREVRKEALPINSFAQVRQAPPGYKGKTLILGGEILETRNRTDGMVLVVLEKPLDRTLRPRALDASGGRFMARFGNYLDPAIFEKGRQITVAGRIDGTESEKIGELPYAYVLLEGREVHLWREGYETAPPWYDLRAFYPYPAWYDPYWGSRPWP